MAADMEPLEIALTLELSTLLLAAVGALATWLHHAHRKAERRQRERHHRDMMRAERQRHAS